MSDTLQDLVDRLEKVNDQLEKRETVPLRQERDDLMREIQQRAQAHRESVDTDWRVANSHLTTHEQIEASRGSAPSPRTVNGGVS